MIEAGHVAFSRLAGALAGADHRPALPAWHGPGRIVDAERLDALLVLVFGADAEPGRVARPGWQEARRLRETAGLAP